MPSTLLDSSYFRDQFSTAAMRAVFSDEARLNAWLLTESTLAQAQAELGVIPDTAAQAIAAAAAAPERLDLAAMKAEFDRTGLAVMPLVHHLAAELDAQARRYLHWGSTTQDILDTGMVVQMRAGLALLEAELDASIRALVRLARTHRETPMAGRSFMQQAAPITFGYKVAVWLDEMLRHRDRLGEMRARVLRLQCGGAVGTLSAMGPQALEVRAAQARLLDLGAPDISWHTARDGWAECLFWLGMVTQTLGKIATEIATLMRSELGEVSEPHVPGRGGSTAMPQKRNPVACPPVIAIATMMREKLGTQMAAMVQEHERGLAAMPMEWVVVPEAFLLTSGAFHHLRPVLEGLEVHAARMRENLTAGGGAIMSQGVMMGLAPHLGAMAAHAAIAAAARRAADAGVSLRSALADLPEVRAHLDEATLDALMDPMRHVGAARDMTDLVLARAQALGFVAQ